MATPDQKEKEWAVFVFMKPDADLELAAVDDVEEMKKVGDTSRFHLALQIERVNDVEQLVIESGTESLRTERARRQPTLNKSLQSFLDWGFRAFPARHRMVILWGHTRGVGFDLTGPREDLPDLPFPSGISTGFASAGENARLVRATQTEAPVEDGHADELTIEQIGTAFQGLTAPAEGRGAMKPGSQAIDILGLDSCYMSSVEFAHQLRNSVRFIVASQSFIRTQGWDYRTILERVAGFKGDLSPRDMGALIVHHVEKLPGATNLSLLDLNHSDTFAGTMHGLVRALQAAIRRDADERRALQIFLKRTAFLKVRQFLDLRDLCHKLRQNFAGEVAERANAVLERFDQLVARNEAQARALGLLNGVSIFYPYLRARRSIPVFDGQEEVDAVVDFVDYKNLDFVRDTGWGGLLDAVEP